MRAPLRTPSNRSNCAPSSVPASRLPSAAGIFSSRSAPCRRAPSGYGAAGAARPTTPQRLPGCGGLASATARPSGAPESATWATPSMAKAGGSELLQRRAERLGVRSEQGCSISCHGPTGMGPGGRSDPGQRAAVAPDRPATSLNGTDVHAIDDAVRGPPMSLAIEILQRSGEHLLLVAIAIALAVLIALPLSLALHRWPRWAAPVLTLANAVQTIPSLAIFGLLLTVPLLGGIGTPPAVVALTLYALLPLLRGFLTGLAQVPAGLKQAGQALGLTEAQVLRHIEAPLALPVAMAGLRVAAVISVGVATIAAAIGAGGLGVFIFRGIATVDNGQILAGALPAAAIALAADAGLGGLERRLSGFFLFL